MYSFGPLPRQKRSGRVIGTHQKIDRVARRQLEVLLVPEHEFPSIRDILHFEGSRGPDGVKLKSPGKDEPWHFIDPADPHSDDRLLVALRQHSHNLAAALKANDETRAAYEAAWLAHAVADGLTPAHHETTYEQEVERLRHQGDDRQDKVRTRIIMSGSGSSKEFVKNNWKYWGAKGVLTTHTLFEAGVATAAKPLSFASARVAKTDADQLLQNGYEQYYLEALHDIAILGMYERFKREGWTRTLARQTTADLMPTIIRAVTLAWYAAYCQSLTAKEIRR